MSMHAMAIVDAHHPETLYVSQIILNVKGILICFFLAWNESLTSFYRVNLDRAYLAHL
jgi:hypothetical protein